jgi:Mg/Co/Ni transporter MgtE
MFGIPYRNDRLRSVSSICCDDHFSRYVYVLSSRGRLVGVAAASELAATPRARLVSDVMVPPLFTSPLTGLDELREFFEAHPIAAVPVVDRRGHLLGVMMLGTSVN